jgi:DNA-binding transcriptional MerR regulator
MESSEMSIGELADSAGLSRRAIRFYVQQGLLPTPLGRGRGRHYDGSHLDALRRIAELQSAGHSLEAIRQIQRGGPVPAPPAADNRRSRPTRPVLSAELWTRLQLAEGLELHFDATKFNPDVRQLLVARDAVRAAFGAEPTARPAPPPSGNSKEEVP